MGYMGHALNIANAALQRLQVTGGPLLDASLTNAAWQEFVDGVLVPTTIARSIRIGGAAPDLRSLGSSGEVCVGVGVCGCGCGCVCDGAVGV